MTPPDTHRFPLQDELSCRVCDTPSSERPLDRMLWCQECRAEARAKATRIGWFVGVAVALPMAAWIFLVMKPTLMLGGWIGVVVGGFWLGTRVGREVLFASYRARWGG